MSKSLLNPEVGGDRPIFHGEPADSVYVDDDDAIIDDVSTDAADTEDDPAWSVDTGAGEFTAPVDRHLSPL